MAAATEREFELSRDLFGVAAFDGRLRSLNPAWAAALGRPEAELLSRPFTQIIHPDDLAETAAVMATLQSGQPAHQFRVRLLKADGEPIAFAGAAEAGRPADVEPELEPGQSEIILVIDDEEPIRMLISDVLGEAGYRVLEAADGPSGLKILRSDTRIDLLITDVGLPGGFNGRQVADATRLGRPHLKVLFLTGYAENAVVGNGHLEPGMQVMMKPFPITALALRVREIIES